MSGLRLAKKFQPARRAWRSFCNTLQHLLNTNIPRAMKATVQRLFSTFHSLRYLLVPSTSRASRSLTSPSYPRSHRQVHRQHLPSTSSSSSSYSSVAEHAKKRHAQGEASREEEGVGKKDLAEGRSGGIDSVEDAWQLVVAKSPLLRVDERAEEFIHKFREDMKLQKERSLLEFQERLARSA